MLLFLTLSCPPSLHGNICYKKYKQYGRLLYPVLFVFVFNKECCIVFIFHIYKTSQTMLKIIFFLQSPAKTARHVWTALAITTACAQAVSRASTARSTSMSVSHGPV